MFLKKLTISNEFELIREIHFHKGLNLIVDETISDDRKKSGNNVGKTTVLRLVDYCFGGDGKNIFRDPEFKDKTNSQIENFLTKNNIVISMTLKDDLESPVSREIVIMRNFLKRREKLLEINGESQSSKGFLQELKELIFSSTTEKPTVRQIVAKNIRDERNRLTNTLRVLNPYTKSEEYESLFLFWLGIDPDTNARKQQLLRKKRNEEHLAASLKRNMTLSQVEQSIIVVDRAIAELQERKDSFDVNEDYEKEISDLNKIKLAINGHSTLLGNLELRRRLILDSKSELEGEVSKVDAVMIRDLYYEARALIPGLQKTFEDTIVFHNQMIQNKVEFITKELPVLEANLARIKREMSQLLAEEGRLANRLSKTGVVKELEKIVNDLNEAFEQKGMLEEHRRLWQASMDRLSMIETELNEINEGIDSKDMVIQARIAELNKYLSRISQRLYGEPYVVSADWGEKGLDLKVSGIGGNLGTGMKKGQIAAFDLAYIQFADAVGIPCLHFVMQDQIENVHDNQITSLLTEVVTEVNCQYILPVLRDKLPHELDLGQYVVLSLSQSDKLFRV